MTPARLGPFALAALTGLLYPLCFPDYDLGLLAWVVLIPLHLALQGAAPRRAFWLGWLAGTIASAGLMGWVVTAMHQYGKMPLAASYPVMWLLAAYLGAFVALYALTLAKLRAALPSLASLAAPFIWVALELLRTYLLSGLPWDLLGYSQYKLLPVIQIADVTGVYGLSFLIVLVNVALADLVRWGLARTGGQPTPLPRLTPTLALGALAATLGYGVAVIGKFEPPDDGPALRVGLVQANIDQAQKWDKAYRQATLDRYIRLTGEAAGDSDLLIWPEAATPFLFEQEWPYRIEVTGLVQRLGVPLLFGSPALRYFPDGRPYLLNSAYLLSTDGEILGRYDKRHLVPFGEYIPLKSSLLFFLDKLVEGIGDFEPGPGPTLLAVPPSANGALPPQPPRFGVAICYEVIFPDLVREAVAAGADFMVTITNDAWFGASSAPYQHFGMVVLRAVENRVAFARAANTGISGFIEPTGRIVKATPIFQERTVKGLVPLATGRSFYTEHGDIFAYGCAIIAGIFLLAARRRGTA